MKQEKGSTFLTKCPACEKTEFVDFLQTRDYFLSGESFSLVKCKNCGLVFTNPIPKPDALPGYYNSPDYLSHDTSRLSPSQILYHFMRSINLQNKYRMIKRYKGAGKALDIGQGTGEFLNYLKQKGWDVTGIEPNEKARAYAAKKYGIEVFDASELYKFQEDHFDLITMWHVLEHLPDLISDMQQIKRVIARDGILVIAVPNLESPDAVHYGEKWAALDVPRHLYHFTRESMLNLLDQFNFDLIGAFPLKMDAYYVSLLSERYRKNKFPYLQAMVSGLRSNLKARKSNNFSSMVFVSALK